MHDTLGQVADGNIRPSKEGVLFPLTVWYLYSINELNGIEVILDSWEDFADYVFSL